MNKQICVYRIQSCCVCGVICLATDWNSSIPTFQWVVEPSSPPPGPFPHQPFHSAPSHHPPPRLHASKVLSLALKSRLVMPDIIPLDVNGRYSKTCKQSQHTKPGKFVIPLPCIASEASGLHFIFKLLISAGRSSLVPVCRIDLNVK